MLSYKDMLISNSQFEYPSSLFELNLMPALVLLFLADLFSLYGKRVWSLCRLPYFDGKLLCNFSLLLHAAFCLLQLEFLLYWPQNLQLTLARLVFRG